MVTYRAVHDRTFSSQNSLLLIAEEAEGSCLGHEGLVGHWHNSPCLTHFLRQPPLSFGFCYLGLPHLNFISQPNLFCSQLKFIKQNFLGIPDRFSSRVEEVLFAPYHWCRVHSLNLYSHHIGFSPFLSSSCLVPQSVEQFFLYSIHHLHICHHVVQSFFVLNMLFTLSSAHLSECELLNVINGM